MADAARPYLEFDLRLQREGFSLEVSASLPAGVTAIFGPSGAGKSTLLGCLSGMVAPEGGFVRMDGETLFSSTDHVRRPPNHYRTALVFQDGMLFPHKTVRENIEYGYRLTPPEHRSIEPDELCRFLEIDDLSDRYPDSLSGGERQRVALARGVASSPRLLMLDEPVAALDIRLRNEVVSYLKRLHERYEIPMLYVSHSLSDVLALAPNVLVLDRGRVKSYGPVVDLVAEMASSNRGVRDDIDNLHAGTVTQPGVVRVGEAEIAGRTGDYREDQRVTVSISASDIMLSLDRPSAISARNILSGVVRRIEIGEVSALAMVDAGLDLMVELTPEAVDALSLKIGDDVYVLFKTSSITITAG